MQSIDYEKLFMEYIEKLTDDDLYNLKKRRGDIYWDFDRKEFFLFIHGSSLKLRCFKVFDTTLNKDFPVLLLLKEHEEYIYDIFNYMLNIKDAIEEEYVADYE